MAAGVIVENVEDQQVFKRLTDKPAITREENTSKKTEFIISVLATAGLDEKSLCEIASVNI